MQIQKHIIRNSMLSVYVSCFHKIVLFEQPEKSSGKKLSMLLENPMSQEMGMMQKDGGGDDYENVS